MRTKKKKKKKKKIIMKRAKPSSKDQQKKHKKEQKKFLVVESVNKWPAQVGGYFSSSNNDYIDVKVLMEDVAFEVETDDSGDKVNKVSLKALVQHPDIALLLAGKKLLGIGNNTNRINSMGAKGVVKMSDIQDASRVVINSSKEGFYICLHVNDFLPKQTGPPTAPSSSSSSHRRSHTPPRMRTARH